MSSSFSFYVVHARRSANKAAHVCASYAEHNTFDVWANDPPSFLLQILQDDCNHSNEWMKKLFPKKKVFLVAYDKSHFWAVSGTTGLFPKPMVRNEEEWPQSPWWSQRQVCTTFFASTGPNSPPYFWKARGVTITTPLCELIYSDVIDGTCKLKLYLLV